MSCKLVFASLMVGIALVGAMGCLEEQPQPQAVFELKAPVDSTDAEMSPRPGEYLDVVHIDWLTVQADVTGWTESARQASFSNAVITRTRAALHDPAFRVVRVTQSYYGGTLAFTIVGYRRR